jgi:hypothetical protein
MTGCNSCAGFGGHHDPTVHDEGPPFRADPDLIDDLEGNERAIRRMRAAAIRMNGEDITVLPTATH